MISGGPTSSPIRTPLLLAGVFALALVARVPGIFWGDDYPGGFRGHHMDEWKNVTHAEMLIAPKSPPRPAGALDACMKGMGVHVAAPVLAMQALSGRDFAESGTDDPRPPIRTLILAGRAVSAVYGALTAVLLFFFARRLTGSDAIALLAAALLALGGLHVSQSHFFLSDVPAIFWSLLATHLLVVELDSSGRRPLALPAAAFCVGVAVGLKVFVLGIPSLAIATLAFRPRWVRSLHAAAFLLAGIVVVNMASMTAVDLAKIKYYGLSLGVAWPASDILRIQLVELLPSLGAPVVALAALGLGAVIARALRAEIQTRRIAIVACVVVLPAVLQVLAVFTHALSVRLDPYPRHLLPLYPPLCLLAAIAAWHLAARFRVRPAWIVAPLLLWQAALVLDTERIYLDEPQHEVLPWLRAHVPAGASVSWPGHEPALAGAGLRPQQFFDEGRPDFIVATLAHLNLYLSGSGLRDSHPRDYRAVTPLITQERLDAVQALFAGRAGYEEVARFPEGYLMPEPRLADAVHGNRERNFLTEVVVFRRKDG